MTPENSPSDDSGVFVEPSVDVSETNVSETNASEANALETVDSKTVKDLIKADPFVTAEKDTQGECNAVSEEADAVYPSGFRLLLIVVGLALGVFMVR
jgi:hypothetical protein